VSFAPLWANQIVKAAAAHAFNRGALVVISAGNGGSTTTSSGYGEALFVGAVDGSDRIASFSNRGRFVDLVAPGTAIRSTRLGSGYGLGNGTSLAAPVVSGVAALAWAVNPDLRPVSIQVALLGTSIDLGGGGKDNTFGHGRVDAHAAVMQALDTAYIPDTTPPSVDVTHPESGAILSGRFIASATVTDSPAEGGVADVVLSIDGTPFATDLRAPYRFALDTLAFSTGPHELEFVATDIAGNMSSAATLIVTFVRSSGSATSGSPADITFETPLNGASVSGIVTIRATVSDDDGLATVEWLVDGDSVLVQPLSGQSSRVSYAWRTAGWPRGDHTITIVVIDAMGTQTRGNLLLIKQ
jgi:subtilisin family serine protease